MTNFLKNYTSLNRIDFILVDKQTAELLHKKKLLKRIL
jgi:hypothetical protein